MKTIDWRTDYYSYEGTNATALANYVSISGSIANGNGTREKPFNPAKGLIMPGASTFIYVVLGNGKMDLTLNYPSGSNTGIPSLIGQSKEGTTINSISGWGGAPSRLMRLKDLRLENFNNPYVQASNCIFSNITLTDGNFDQNCSIANCIFYGRPVVLRFSNGLMTSRSTFVKSPILPSIFKSPTALLVQSEAYIDQTTLANHTNYMAFNKCKFTIGAEASATALTGNNATELRANFVSRCVAQGLTVPSVTEFGSTTSAGRWIFSNNSICGDYNTIKDSEIDLFAKLRGIYFGHTNTTVNQVPITASLNIPASFAPINECGSQTSVQNDSIGLLTTSDFTKRINAYADSKIIWLGGLSKLTALSLTHNLPIEAGITADSVFGLAKDFTPSGSIEANCHYIIRSKDSSLATIKYNNVQYTSSLITRNNVFLSTGEKNFENISLNAEIYQVLDFANHPSMQIRLMREIPSGNITTGNLQAGYWYFVEPNNLNDTSGTVTYKGVVRPAFDSFVAESGNLTFTINGTCHLRRCWKQDFSMATETTDKSFWEDRQKPYYFDVVSEDLRCLLKNNSSASVELSTVDGTYVGSGHPDFYNSVNGVNGQKLPAYNIVGTYLQIRVPISSINPM